jgi:hypothetical protein
MKKVADYVRLAKQALGDTHMSDRELGELLGGYSSSTVSNARYGKTADPFAMKLAEVLKLDAGEILLVARAEREKDARVRDALLAYAKKVLASVPSKAANAIAACAVALWLSLQPQPAEAVGGVGRSR